jgi:hypothetical protein
MDDKYKKIKIELNNDDRNVIFSTTEYSNIESFKNFPGFISIANEGLTKSQWLTLKSVIEKTEHYVGLSENGTPIEWDKKSILKKINEMI